MFSAFQFSVPTRVYFEEGALVRLNEELAKEQITKVLVATDRGIRGAGLCEALGAMLQGAGVSFEVFDEVEANPSSDTVEKGAQIYRETGCQAVVALGGGSPIDAAKGIGILVTNGGNIVEYEGLNRFSQPPAPLYMVPTTAGTGSEVTPFAVITNRRARYKLTIASPLLMPKAAFLDVRLLGTLPAAVAAATGMDALTHAVEAYLSLAASPFSDMMAEKALALMGGNLRRFVANRTDLEAAGAMLLGSMFAGIAFGHARLGNCHAMAHPLGGFFDLPHGVANAILLPHVMRFNLLADRGKYARIAALLGEEVPERVSPVTAGERAIAAVEKLNRDLAIPRSLREVGASEDAIDQMAEDAMKSGNILVNPRKTTLEDIKQLYRQAFH